MFHRVLNMSPVQFRLGSSILEQTRQLLGFRKTVIIHLTEILKYRSSSRPEVFCEKGILKLKFLQNSEEIVYASRGHENLF